MGSDNMLELKRVFEDVLGFAVQKGNSIQILKNGKEIFPSMLEAIETSQYSIEFLTFVYWKGDIAQRFATSLSQKAREGVSVRVILDSLGCQRMPTELVDQMQQNGVVVEWFRPLLRWKIWKSDHRTHRKILVCDRKVAFTGGVGIADEWDGDAENPSQWRDTHFKIEGPAVSGIFSGFVGNWLECGRKITELCDFKQSTPTGHRGKSAIQVIRSPAAYGWTDFATLLRLILSVALKHINITTAYFNPDETASKLLQAAAQDGVKITILVPGKYSDQKIAKIAGEAKYEPLLNSGIRIMQYQQTMLHAKILTVDGRFACVGSPNLNQRSMRKDDELGLTVFDPKVVEILDDHFNDDLQVAEAIEYSRWQKRGFGRKVLELGVKQMEKEI